MKTPEKKMKKLKRSRLWPSIVLFIVALFLGVALLAAEFSIFASYVVESKYAQTLTEAQRIAGSVEAQLRRGEEPAAALEQSLDGDRRAALIDEKGSVLASHGALTADLSHNAWLEMGGEHEIYWDKAVSGATARLQKKTRGYGGEERSLDALDVLSSMAVSGVHPEELIGTVADESIQETIMNCAYWQSVPLSGGGKLLVKSALTIQKGDLFFAIAIIAVSGVLFLLILTLQFVSIISKIRSNRRMEKLLLTDSVTGADNYLAFTQKASKLLQKKGAAGKTYAVAELSLVKYHSLCSMHGTAAGERLLAQLDRMIARHLEKKELSAHVSGGKFALFLSAEPGEEGKEKTARRVRDLIAELNRGPAAEDGAAESDACFDFSKLVFQAGICFLEGAHRGADVNGLYVNAGTAMSSLALEDAGAVACFSQKMWEERLWQHKVETTMQSALDNEEFQVYVQPKYDPNTNKLLGGEALVRWISPTEGMIPPGRFIPIFEKTGFVVKLDDYMISHVAKLQSQWIAQGRQIVPISVNVSRAHFAQSDLAEHIRDLVDAYHVPHEYVEIELTESAFFDDKKMLLTTVHKLQEYGFDVSMDDFGAGYSSLNSLKDLPLNVLKIDADFFRGDDFGTRGRIVVSEVIALAKQLNMRIVAEGVEKEDQVDFLAEQHCDMIQGYYYAKPMPAEEYAQRLEE